MTAADRESRACCGSWRRRSSVRWPGGTGSSTIARMPSRRRSSPLPCNGPKQGVPDNPRGWLITVGSRRLTDELRSDARPPPTRGQGGGPPSTRGNGRGAAGRGSAVDEDDTLTLLLLCCHPALSPASQVALTLRAVGGLTTAQIARAFLVPESTMAQRISRAKQTDQVGRRPVRHAAGRRARGPIAGRAARAVPRLQRGLHGERGSRPATGRPDRGGDPARPRPAPPAPGRGRDCRAARTHAPDRCPAAGADPARRQPRPARRAGPQPVERGLGARGRGTHHGRHVASSRRAVPAAGGDRRRPRRGRSRRRHGLAADRRPLRAARSASRPTRW